MITKLLLTLVSIISTLTFASPTPAAAQYIPMACDYGPSQRGISCHELNRAVAEAADEFRIDHARFRRMVACESKYDPHVDTNRPYVGFTQQSLEFWNRWAPRFNAAVAVDLGAGRPYASRYHPWDNARLAAYVISLNGYDEWECKGY